MLKKILAGLLAMVMVMSFAACSEKENGSNNEATATTDMWKSEIVYETTAPYETEEPTEDPTVEGTEPATESVVPVGNNSGNTYINEFIGIRCTLDENWVLMTNEEIRAQNESILGMVGGDYEEMISFASSLYDMMAINVNEMDTVAVTLEMYNASTALMSEEQIIAASKDMTVATLESMGFEIEAADVVTVQFAGAEHAALMITGNLLGTPIYECAVVIKRGDFYALIAACTWVEDGCMDVLNMFQPI